MGTIPVSAVMRQKVITVREHITLQELARLLTEKNITGAPVLNAAGNLAGVVSLTDIARYASRGSRFPDGEQPPAYYTHEYRDFLLPDATMKTPDNLQPPAKVPVSAIMTRATIHVRPETSIQKVARMMVENQIHRLLVVRKEKLLGIVTTIDILKLIAYSDDISCLSLDFN